MRNIKKEVVVVGLFGLLLGAGVATVTAAYAVNNNKTGLQEAMGMRPQSMPASHDHSTMSMADMTTSLTPLAGQAYDTAFTQMMIAHHQGAVDMAKLSPSRAKDQAVKDLSLSIITTQEKEIKEMHHWLEHWRQGESATHSDEPASPPTPQGQTEPADDGHHSDGHGH